MIPTLATLAIITISWGSVFNVFLIILGLLIVWGLGRYFFPKLGMPPVGMTCWDGFFVLIAAALVLNFLASLAGHPFIRF